MTNLGIRVLTVACCFALAALAVPALGEAAGFGCQSCAAPAIAVAPAYTGCATQTCGYAPAVVYSSYYQPAVVTAYRPVVAYSAYTSYAAYRPWWTYRAQLVPYTTYQPVYWSAPVVAYSGCSPCSSSSPCSSCSPCATGSCGAVISPAPTSGCLSCASVESSAPQKTFQGQEQEKVQKPATETELKPIPESEIQLNSTPAPLLPDPRDRTALRTPYAARVTLVGNPAQTSVHDGWQPARD